MQERKYARRSWKLLTREKGWFKPVLVMAAANLVPIAGVLGTSGYALEWARLTAWGVDASPKQKNVQVGACIGSGWRAFVVALVWTLCLTVAVSVAELVVGFLPGLLGDLLQLLLTIVVWALELIVYVVATVACVRASIYEQIGAGLRFDRVLDMVRRDTKGFFSLVLTAVVFMLAMGLVAAVVALVLVVPFVPVIIASEYGSTDYATMMALSQVVGFVIVIALLLWYALSIVGSAWSLVFYNAVGLWMRQFDVPSWGRSEDPLPDAAPSVGRDDTPQEEAAQPSWDEYMNARKEDVEAGTPSEPTRKAEPAQPFDLGEQRPDTPAQPADAQGQYPSTRRIVENPTVRLEREDAVAASPDMHEAAAAEVEHEPAAMEPDVREVASLSAEDVAEADVAPSPTDGDALPDVEDLYSQLRDVMSQDDE